MTIRTYNSIPFEDYEAFQSVYESVSSAEELHAYSIFKQTLEFCESRNREREEIIDQILQEVQALVDSSKEPKYMLIEQLLSDLSKVESK